MTRSQGTECPAPANRRSACTLIILFELLTGGVPFRGNTRMLLMQLMNDDPPNPRKLNGNVPRDLAMIALKCLEKRNSAAGPPDEDVRATPERTRDPGRGRPGHAGGNAGARTGDARTLWPKFWPVPRPATRELW